MLIPETSLRATAARIFIAAGSAPEEAGIVADHLVEANLRGHDSHGVGMIPTYMRNLAAGTLIPNRAGQSCGRRARSFSMTASGAMAKWWRAG